MTTFSIRNSLFQIAVTGILLSGTTALAGCENMPVSDPPAAQQDAPKAQPAKQTDQPVHRPHTAGRDFDTIY
jgi:hypothetical protein